MARDDAKCSFLEGDILVIQNNDDLDISTAYDGGIASGV